ncbi:MAG: ABC transporter ATP-binding protein, partial [Clostridia bacterium]|nr:ABC transporter ATP-binding protein [Clostridia bacterium]
MNGKRPMPKKGTLSRTLKLLFSFYPVLAPLTVVCILFAAVVSALPALFIQEIIAAIEFWQPSGDFNSAIKEILPQVLMLAGLYVLSLLATTAQTQLMAYMTQGFLSKMRCMMFDGMQNLPIRYFDSNRHGDIMSHYTNDIDTLRELVSRALPSLLQASVVVLTVFSVMLYFSVTMTLVLLVGVAAMLFTSRKLAGGSAKFFIRQQKSMGATEGYIQEMMNGQKVVKVFCHEKAGEQDFDAINNQLYEDSKQAHAYANMLGPIIMNIGNIIYVIIAMV